MLSGHRSWCRSLLDTAIAHHVTGRILTIGDLHNPLNFPADSTTRAQQTDALRFLGHEFDHAVIDFHDGIDPNVLGAISGTVSGGGLLFLLLPPVDDLPAFDDPEKQRMAIWPHTPHDVHNRFLRRLTTLIRNARDITLIEQLPHLTITAPLLSEPPAIIESSTNQEPATDRKPLANKEPSAGKEPLAGKELLTSTQLPTAHEYLNDEDICRTVDQQTAVQAIQHVATGHRHRPLVIVANRGRGKSAALGIASALLMKTGTARIIVTGPRRSAADQVFKHARTQLGSHHAEPGRLPWQETVLEFVAPDVLCQQTPPCQLLLVDEAAAIPAPLLEQLLNRYARVVFATTTYGYEGTGRGFTVKFQQTLDQQTPGWRLLEMHTPVRWAPRDPAETFVFDTLCLDARVEPIGNPLTAGMRFEKLDRDRLVHDETLLSAIFGLLILAHYQTQPRDLRYLMDAIGLDIYVAKQDNNVIGTAVIEHEGELDPNTADAVYRNERRVTGHLLPQTLESFVGIRNASAARYCRVIRIAVHPDYRRRGIGRDMLRYIESDLKNQHIDIIGSNFGASGELLKFWQVSGFLPVHVGLTRNASTGNNSVTYIKPLSCHGGTINRAATTKFHDHFPLQLAEPYHDLACDIAQELFSSFSGTDKLTLTGDQWQDIESFAHSRRGYEINRVALRKLVMHVFCHATLKQIPGPSDRCLLIQKVLQQQSWREIVDGFGFEGKHHAVEQLKHCIRRLISNQTMLDNIDVSQHD